MKLCIVLGTRPEIIKMAPVIRECQKRGLDFFVLHTGQHYSPNMDRAFFRDLALAPPKYNLGIGNQPHRKQVGIMVKNIKKVLAEERPEVVIVQGDTISVLAGALAAQKLGIKIGHHEAGLRSHDPTMLEETNRVTTDHVSDFLFAPTRDALSNLKEEGYPEENIFHSGNTVVDAVVQNMKIAKKKSTIIKKLGLTKKKYIFTTFHRAENVDNPERLTGILKGLELVHERFGLPLICPMHPRTANKIKDFGLKKPAGLRCVAPVGYLDSLMLQANAKLVLTDSGGLQEESCILGIPCVTLRDNTERPETIKMGANMLVGVAPERILAGAVKMISKKGGWKNPFGNGRAAEHIIGTLVSLV